MKTWGFLFSKPREFQDGNHSALNQVSGASQSRVVRDYTDPSPARWDKVLLLLLLLSCFSRVQLCATPQTAAHQALPPWDSPGKNTGVGCHFLFQCKKVKRESEVAQLCPTLHNPMDCSPLGSSAHAVFQARVLEWGAIAFSLNEYWSYLICFRNQRASLPSDCLSPAEFPCIFANQSYVCCLLAGKVICQ